MNESWERISSMIHTAEDFGLWIGLVMWHATRNNPKRHVSISTGEAVPTKIRTLLSLPNPDTQATNSTVRTLSFLTKKKWFERGVKEAIWEHVEKTSLNKKGGLRFLLSHAWDPILKQLPHRMSHDQADPQSSVQSDEGPAIGLQCHLKLYGESSNWFTIYPYMTQLDDWEHS